MEQSFCVFRKNDYEWNKSIVCGTNQTENIFTRWTELERFNSKELKIWIRRNKVESTCGMQKLVPKDDGTKFYFPWNKNLNKWNKTSPNGTTYITSRNGTKIKPLRTMEHLDKNYKNLGNKITKT
jgi:hypothetical protein